MSNVICIDPTMSGKACSFVFRDGQSHYIVDERDKSQWQFLNNNICVCFDCLRVMDYGFSSLFLNDIKILYELKGNKIENLTELGKLVLGAAAVAKYIDLSTKIKAHLTSYRIAKIDISNFNEHKLYSSDLYYSFYRERGHLILELYKNYCDENNIEVSDFYKSMYDSIKTIHSVASRALYIDLEAIKNEKGHHVKAIYKNVSKGLGKLKFHIVGAKTGRLAFKKGSINIYGWPKNLRKCLIPAQDCNIVEFDFKSFQPRLAIMATSDERFKDKFRNIKDIYSIFPGDRQKNKLEFLTWMYWNNKNETFEKEAFPICEFRNELYIKARNSGKIINKFGRVLHWSGEEKHVVFQNYVTSLEVDAILKLVRLMNDRLKNTKSRILFPFHDSVVCEINKGEQNLIDELKILMESYLKLEFNSLFPVEIKIGKNFGEMVEYGQK